MWVCQKNLIPLTKRLTIPPRRRPKSATCIQQGEKENAREMRCWGGSTLMTPPIPRPALALCPLRERSLRCRRYSSGTFRFRRRVFSASSLTAESAAEPLMCDGELTRGPLKERIWGELKHCSLLCVDIPGRNLSDLGPPTTLRTEWTPSRRVDPPFAPEAAAVRAGFGGGSDGGIEGE